MVPFAADKGASGTTAQEQLVNQELTIVTHDVSGVTRRTRSGTVTLASVAASKAAATRRAAERPSGSIGHEHASPLRVHKRSNAGWPTIQMKTNDEPLRLAPGDDEDDELLLKRGSSID
ncbi:uncharacterized protein C8Q71DRAFT_745697 [Rhodofomes roseus]|nr:uncharacterized protein C8Q71DRAFT_745697 [Rhodofomes roseus]KAH9840077.1 hypothetical protein C8Q71DRAFT_745697 [Rhodofomes roseus]